MRTRTLNGILWINLGALVAFPLALQAAGPVQAVSAWPLDNVAGIGGSFTPSFSADGQFVVFVSYANNLVTNDDSARHLDVFVRDLFAGTSALVSGNTNGVGGGNDDANFPGISSNGQFVAFASAASNLVPGDSNNASDIFLRDTTAGATRLISVDLSGISPVNPFPASTRLLSGNPQISADGHRVVFESLATNLVALADTNQQTDIFTRDWQANETVLVSVNSAGTGAGNGRSEFPRITPDGRFVAFVSTATDLVAGVTNRQGDIYVRDLQANATFWASTNVGVYFPASSNGYRCANPILSTDGQFVAFSASSTNVTLVFHHDLLTGVSTVLTSNAPPDSWPTMSADGRFVAYEGFTNVYAWDRQTGSNELVSVNVSDTGPGNARSHTPVISPDGSRIVFLSAATNLVATATNGVSQVYVRDQLMGTTRLVSENVDGVASTTGIDITLPAISQDGEWVTFESGAEDLAPNDLNRDNDVFVRDIEIGATVLVSRRHLTLPALTGVALSKAGINSISADGRYALFTTYDYNYFPSVTNGRPEVFRRDLATGAMTPVSLDTNDLFNSALSAVQPAMSANGEYAAFVLQVYDSYPGNQADVFRRDLKQGITVRVNSSSLGSSLAPAISSNGRLVAFDFPPTVNYIVPGVSDPNSGADIILRDMLTGTNQVVSLNRLGMATGNRPSSNIVFSSNDRWLLFSSLASDMVANTTNQMVRLYARDLWSNTTALVSLGPADDVNWGYTRGAVFAADSRHVAFVSTNVTVSPSIAVHDLQTQSGTVVCTNCDAPSLSSNGRLVAFTAPAGGFGPTNVFVKDLQTGVTKLISVNLVFTSGGNRSSSSPLISGDGRFVVFVSQASDLAASDNNNTSDLFVRDRLLGQTLLITMNHHGTGSANGPSSKPIMATDGRTVVFQSFASDLVPGDYNDKRDVFVLHLGGLDSDGDSLDDDWEMAYFSTLARNGTGDFDQDGATDYQEFLAGSDPTNSGSILRVLLLTSPGSSSTTLLWSAVPGQRYVVQFKEQVDQATWTDLPGAVTATSTTAVKVDPTAEGQSQRFYRVLRAE